MLPQKARAKERKIVIKFINYSGVFRYLADLTGLLFSLKSILKAE